MIGHPEGKIFNHGSLAVTCRGCGETLYTTDLGPPVLSADEKFMVWTCPECAMSESIRHPVWLEPKGPGDVDTFFDPL